MNCYNIWKVSAWHKDGYHKDLGYYEGYLDYIALRLWTDSYVYLYFNPVSIQKFEEINCKLARSANICVPVPGDSVALLNQVMILLSNRNVDVMTELKDPRYVTIKRPLSLQEQADEKIEEILNKYSYEDKKKLLELLKERYGG